MQNLIGYEQANREIVMAEADNVLSLDVARSKKKNVHTGTCVVVSDNPDDPFLRELQSIVNGQSDTWQNSKVSCVGADVNCVNREVLIKAGTLEGVTTAVFTEILGPGHFINLGSVTLSEDQWQRLRSELDAAFVRAKQTGTPFTPHEGV